jgi:hypothetical protein
MIVTVSTPVPITRNSQITVLDSTFWQCDILRKFCFSVTIPNLDGAVHNLQLNRDTHQSNKLDRLHRKAAHDGRFLLADEK